MEIKQAPGQKKRCGAVRLKLGLWTPGLKVFEDWKNLGSAGGDISTAPLVNGKLCTLRAPYGL